MPTAFVTGCATGFGHALVRELLARGWHVVASDPSLDRWPAALGAPRPDLQVHAVDVRDQSQIDAAVADVSSVDLVVNNAGYALFATQEEGDVEAVRDMLDVNVLGPVRVTRALLPALRKARGTVVQLSSVAGRTAFPESGFYAASKYAVEALSEALFAEVCTFGIRVRLMEPGSFATEFLSRAAEESPQPEGDSPYAHLRPRWTQAKREVLEAPQDPMLVVSAILASLDDPAPFRRVVVGPDAARILALREALGPDPWARLAADRNAFEGAPHGADEVPSPAELLAEPPGSPRWELARTAHRHGHLAHWEETEQGRRALAQLGDQER
ncbi:MAG: SDR family oxidoreductase [Myxococcales bacterium]|nr:SDR family oxidoreductase [Myxococcales bacterium]